MGRIKRTKKPKMAENFKKVRKALNRTQFEFSEMLGISEQQIRNYESDRQDIPFYIIDLISNNKQFYVNEYPIRKNFLFGLDDFMTDYDCIPHSEYETIQILNESAHILNSLNPEIYRNHLSKYILELTDLNGFSKYKTSEIYDKKNYVTFMESEIRHSIEAYMQHINPNTSRKDDDNEK